MENWWVNERERETIIVNYELMMVSKRFRKVYYKCDMSSLFPAEYLYLTGFPSYDNYVRASSIIYIYLPVSSHEKYAKED